MRVLIVEDEEIAFKNLERSLKEIDSKIQVLDWKTSVKDTIQWLTENPSPDVLFLDIQLSDGTAFDIFESITTDISVIFITAYDEYAIKAFEVNSIDYLLKPVGTERLKTSIDKFKKLNNKININKEIIEQIKRELIQLPDKQYKQRFLIKTGDRYFYIDINDIYYFFADGNIVFAVTKENKKAIVNHSLQELETILNPSDYFRINRKYIICIKSFQKVARYFGGRLKITLNPSPVEDIIVGKAKAVPFLRWIES